MVANKTEAYVLFGVRNLEDLANSVYACSTSIKTRPKKVSHSRKELLQEGKTRLLLEREKLALMEKSLTEKEDEITALELEQELE